MSLHRRMFHAVAVALVAAAPVARAQAAGVDLDTLRAGRFDHGKMWTFEYAPSAYFTETYGFDANAAWFERARLSALRIPGCSASFVSPFGLLATNHHCVRSRVAAVSQPGEALLDNGFYAASLDAERPIPGYYADQLIAAEDVSERVFAAMDRATTDAERESAREQAFDAEARQRFADIPDSIRVQIVGLYQGGRYSMYVFRRFTDVRLVAAAELQLGFFGGDYDNFTYPRYALDFAFLRVYGADGRPYETEHYFGWSPAAGVEEGSTVFVIGNPGPTNRGSTVAQLEFQRDVTVPAAVAFLASRHAALGAYRAADPAQAEAIDVRNRMFSLSNSLKANTGRLEALHMPVIMAKRGDAERRLREGVMADPELRTRFGTTLDRVAELQGSLRAWAGPYAAFYRLGASGTSSSTLRRALVIATVDASRARAQLDRIEELPAMLERQFLVLRFRDVADALGADHPVTRALLQGQTPEAAADALLAQSALTTDAGARRALDDGTAASDPAVALVRALLPALVEFQQGWSALAREEEQLAADLGRARFAVFGQSVPPDATSSPRITDGVVVPYEYNGTVAPVYTTFFGLYDRWASFGVGTDWELPERWRTPPPGLDLRTPLNFISTADTYGGNSGSPAVTPTLELVGLNFDRNIQGLSRDFIYLPEQGRNMMVDVRAIHAALDHVYDAHRIVLELTTHRLFTTEGEADEASR